MRLSARTLLPVTFALMLPAAALATGDKASRYPFDPVCPWGRLSNGKGMLHRCISAAEARTLAEASDVGKAKPAEDPKPAPSKQKPKSLPKGYDLEVGPISADEGSITVGRLHVPAERYRECIDKNGGLTKPAGKVIVKFLVRAERLRAEGASVASFDNVSSQAAECIAAVVDRRKVGAPSVPMTGAKLTFSLREKK